MWTRLTLLPVYEYVIIAKKAPILAPTRSTHCQCVRLEVSLFGKDILPHFFGTVFPPGEKSDYSWHLFLTHGGMLETAVALGISRGTSNLSCYLSPDTKPITLTLS